MEAPHFFKSPWTRHLSFGLFLALVAFFIYQDGLDNFFYNDDFNLLYAAKYRSIADILTDNYPPEHFQIFSTPYWRPGWHILFKIFYTFVGLDHGIFVLAGIAMHLFITYAIYALAFRSTKSTISGFLAGLLFLSSPVYLEAVFWPSASLSGLPAAAFLLLAVWAWLAFSSRKSPKLYIAALLFFALSLTFKEAVYVFPILAFFACLVIAPQPLNVKKAVSAALVSSPFLLVVVLHYVFLNRFNLGEFPLEETSKTTFHVFAKYFQEIVHLEMGPAPFLIGACLIFLILAYFCPGIGRFLIIWAALSPFPFAARAFASRFTYFCHIPLALFAGWMIGQLLGRKGKARIFGSIAGAVLALLALLNMTGIHPEIEHHRMEGEKCRNILSWCEENEIMNKEVVYIDFVIPALANGFEEMIDLYLGKRVDIKNLLLLPLPPFLIYGDPRFPDMDPETPILRFKPQSQTAAGTLTMPTYEKYTRDDISRNLYPLPMFGFRSRYRVVKPNEALKLIREGDVDLDTTVLLNREPSLPIPRGGSKKARILNVNSAAISHVSLRVHCPEPCFLLICLPARLDSKKGKVKVDDRKVLPFQANGRFNALELDKGHHLIVATFL